MKVSPKEGDAILIHAGEHIRFLESFVSDRHCLINKNEIYFKYEVPTIIIFEVIKTFIFKICTYKK